MKKRKRVSRGLRLFLTEENIGVILRESAGNPRDHALLHTQASTGLRISDILKIELADALEPDGSVVEQLRVKQKKTGSYVTRLLRPDARAAIEAYLGLKKAAEERLKAGRSQWLFPSLGRNRSLTSDRPLTRMQAHRILKKYLAKLNIAPSRLKGAATHTLRRSVAKNIARREGVETASAWLGHDDSQSTSAYIDLDDLEKRAERAVLEMRW